MLALILFALGDGPQDARVNVQTYGHRCLHQHEVHDNVEDQGEWVRRRVDSTRRLCAVIVQHHLDKLNCQLLRRACHNGPLTFRHTYILVFGRRYFQAVI